MQGDGVVLREGEGPVFLIAAAIEDLDAEERSVDELCARLGVHPPPLWPPDLNDADSRAYFRHGIVNHPRAPDWWAWYVIYVDDGVATLVGTAGFKGPPDSHGTVEIGYSILGPYQRRGIATLAMRLLMRRAARAPELSDVIAETFPTNAASIRVMVKCGLTYLGTRIDPFDGELVRYGWRPT